MSSVMPDGNGFILLDGARYKHATAWLYQHFPSHQPTPLLLGTAYEAIADGGPILLDASVGSMAYEAWRHGAEIKDGLWLESTASMDDMQRILRRRLRVFTPEHGEFWLRLGDARPLFQAWQRGVQWPEGFWHRISRVWLHHEGKTFCAWQNEHPENDGAPAECGLAAQMTLDWRLLEALAEQNDTAQEALL
ncbi:DUF4123 domain-containing protein [Pseudomonas sp. 9Ag]|uniref:DUF4123 domain-containing protein n=1 Tax=Pseudomonas sp. 9Ag TaxID=2653167 RepID=UPI0012F2A6DD|nr:DUF4123 domain-containing protein [Pseudomonas sp. 9Ag]VXC12239.1 conserved hypothetical protein [Pseudomonas sp. 9Ag]